MEDRISQLGPALSLYREDASHAQFPKLLGQISVLAGIQGDDSDEIWNGTIDFLDAHYPGWRGTHGN